MQFRIGHKIIASYGLLILLTFGLGWYQLENISRLRYIALRAIDGDLEMAETLGQLGNGRRDMALLLERATAAHLLRKANATAEDPFTFIRERALAADRTRAVARRLVTQAEHNNRTSVIAGRQQIWAALRTIAQQAEITHEEIATTGNTLLELIRRDDLAEYRAGNEVIQRLYRDAATQETRTNELLDRLSAAAKEGVEDLSNDVRTNSLIALAVVVVVGALIAYAIYRSIATPVRDFMRFAERVGSGDLTRKLDDSRRDELGQLSTHFNDMVSSLNTVARQIRTASENLNTATAEMQASVQQHATSTTEQSAAVQQITTTLTEIARSGAQISERSKVVAQNAEAASATSKAGIHAVNETNRSMGLIRDQAEKVATNIVALTERTQSIGAIIATVNDLSERSNLLALNAAIEAAAAGEHGASFAVVADEIKNLANQAKEATSEVRSILSDVQHRIGTAVMQTEEAVKRADAGRTQATAAEGTINELARSIDQSVSTFEQIVAATSQQQVGIEQVTQSVTNIRESSEQMAAGSREVGVAATNLAALSEQILKVVDRYRV